MKNNAVWPTRMGGVTIDTVKLNCTYTPSCLLKGIFILKSE